MRIAAVLALVDGFVDAADGAVEAGLAQDELDDAVLHGLDAAEGPPVPGHDGRLLGTVARAVMVVAMVDVGVWDGGGVGFKEEAVENPGGTFLHLQPRIQSSSTSTNTGLYT